MTTTPIANLLGSLVPGATASAPTGQQGAGGSTADAFLALVQGMLDDASAQPAADPSASTTGDVSAELPDTVAEPATDDTEAPADVAAAPALDPTAAATVVPVIVSQALQIQPPTQAQAQPMAPEASTPIEAVTSVASVATATTTATTAAAAAAPKVAKLAAPTADKPTNVALPADAPAPATSSTTSKVELPDVAVQAVEQRPATPELTTEQPAAAPAPAPTSAPSVAPVSGVAPVATTAVASAPSDTHQVAQQVFPEVVRVVNNPNGPQRVTIKLNPEALGEVRVVLTSRRGGLEVSLAAGSEARAALTNGAHELQRLLETVGRGDSRIVVRDLLGSLAGTTVSQPAAAPSSGGSAFDLAGGAGTGTGRPGGDATSGQQPRNHSTGSNGAADGAQGSTNPSQPNESVTRAHSGLDVTM